jgi:hypothetical protein
MASRTLTVGETRKFTGDVTTLNAIGGPRPPAAIEEMLGFRAGRLSQGYYFLLLKDGLTAGDFDFGGTTMRSGGRYGKPQASRDDDGRRTHVSSQMRHEYGEAEYERRKQQLAPGAQTSGPRRLAKIFPVEGLGDTFSPAVEFPMGGGGLQWTLIQPKTFLIALEVTSSLMAIGKDLMVSIDPGQTGQQLLANRTEVARYLENA